MKANIKANLIYFLSFIIIFFLVKGIFIFIFNVEIGVLTSFFSAGIAAALSLRKSIIQTQSGKQIQLKWIFSKKVIIVK
jgi:uncharacterized membrane protein